MKIEIGTLIEVARDSEGSDKMAVVKIDQGKQKVVLENQQTGEKIEMSFPYFESISGMTLDKRQVLHG